MLKEDGIAIIPESLVKKEIENGVLQKIDLVDQTFTREYYLIFHPNK